MITDDLQSWATEHRPVFTDISTAVFGLEVAMRHANEVGERQGDGPAVRDALRQVSAEAERCVAVLRRVAATPPAPDVQFEVLFREMVARRRMWANQIRKASVRRDVAGMDRAEHHAAAAHDLDEQLRPALREAWPAGQA